MRKLRSDPEKHARQRRMESARRAASPRYALNQGLHNAKQRAGVSVSADHLFDIWRAQHGLCVLTGIQMTWGAGRILPTSISIDRVDQGLGYVTGNIRLVCYAVNCFRGRMTDAEMLTMAKTLIANMNKET